MTRQQSPGGKSGALENVAGAGSILAELHAENADAWWRDCAERAVSWWAEAGVQFTANDVRDLGVPEADHPARWGALFSAMRARGVIAPVGYTTSTRRSRHGGVLRIWQGVSAHADAV